MLKRIFQIVHKEMLISSQVRKTLETFEWHNYSSEFSGSITEYIKHFKHTFALVE